METPSNICRGAASFQRQLCIDLGLGGSRRSTGTKVLTRRAPSSGILDMDWCELESQFRKRAGTAQCPVCMESFTGEEVILSCSHVFHSACITSFERFRGQDRRQCPICRARNYERKATALGIDCRRQECAVYIQARFRGMKARQKYRDILREHFRGGAGSSLRRRAYIAQELCYLSNDILRRDQQKDDKLNEFLAELDSGLQYSRDVMSCTERQLPPSKVTCNWSQVLRRARTRGATDCPICMVALDMASERKSSSKRILLCSCSHAFHEQCILSFESYNITLAASQDEETRLKALCPVCRSTYDKICIDSVT
jgi:hypothetical protein